MILRPDLYSHNNPDLAFVDSNSVRGGNRTVADLTALYALSSKSDQLKQYVTRVFVQSNSKWYTLIDINNIGNSLGWAVDAAAGTLQEVTNNGATTTNAITTAGLTITGGNGLVTTSQFYASASNIANSIFVGYDSFAVYLGYQMGSVPVHIGTGGSGAVILRNSGGFQIESFAGTGTRMVVVGSDGTFSTQSIPTNAVSSVFGRTGAVTAQSGDYTTAQVTESGNLYYTDARARAALSAGTGVSYNSTTGAISIGQSVATTASPAFNNATFNGTISVSMSNASGGGIILSDDGDIVDLQDGWASMRFTEGVCIYSGNKTGTAAISLGSNGQVTATQFNGSGAGLTGTASSLTAGAVTNGVYTNGSYSDPSWITSLAWSKINGAESGVRATVLTGLNVTGGTVTSSDSILTAFGKVQNQLNGLFGGVTYQGTWNASTNTPTLTSSVGTKGHYYIVSVDGSTNLNGITDWKLGDWAIFNGSTWDKVDNTDAVVSVNGFTGAVSLTTANISEVTNLYYTDARSRAAISVANGTAAYNSSTGVITIPTTTAHISESGNLFYTDARARAALSFVAGSGAYNSSTGVITIPTNTNQLTNGAGFITGITGSDVTTALGYTPYNSTNPSGYLSSVSLTSNVTGTLPVANGGTGQTTIAGIQSALGLGSYAYRSSGLAELSGATFTAPIQFSAGTGANWQIYKNGGNNNFEIFNNGSAALTINTTGAATFSSSVTATSFIRSGGTADQILAADGSVITAGSNITISGGVISSTGGGGGGGISGSGAANQLVYWTGASAVTGNNALTFNPTAPLFLNNAITASGGVARGAEFRPILTVAATNDDLVGFDIVNSFRGGILTGSTSAIGLTAAGTGYVAGTYTNVPLTGGTGTGALATIVVGAGTQVTSVTVTTAGSGYTVGDVLSASNANLGGTGSGFQGTIRVLANTPRLIGMRVDGVNIGRGNGYIASNTAIGANALRVNVSGTSIVAIGSSALQNNTTGGNQVAIGASALQNNTVGANNTAVGFQALFTNTTGSQSTAIGSNALANNTGGSNTAIGHNAIAGAGAGSNNTAIGQAALVSLTTGGSHVAIGQNALQNITTSSNNIGIGPTAGRFAGSGTTTNTTSSGSIYIGFDTRASANGNNNEIVIAGYTGSGNGALGLGSNTTSIGNSATTATFLYGRTILGTTTDNGADRLQVSGTIRATSSVTATGFFESSDIRLKDVIKEMTSFTGIDTIIYKWKDRRDHLDHIGYKAQQVEEILPYAVSESNGYKTVDYNQVHTFKIMLLEDRILKLEDELKQYKNAI